MLVCATGGAPGKGPRLPASSTPWVQAGIEQAGCLQGLVEGEGASWQGGLWGWQWVGAAVVAEVGEEVEAVEAREWKQGLASKGQWGRGRSCQLDLVLLLFACCLEHWCSRTPN